MPMPTAFVRASTRRPEAAVRDRPADVRVIVSSYRDHVAQSKQANKGHIYR